MGFYSGRDGELYIGNQTTSKAAKIQSWSFSSSMAVLETTSMGDTDRTLKSGVRSYSGSCRLFYYVSDISSDQTTSNINGLIDAAIKAEDENLKKVRGKTILQRNKPIRPIIKKKPVDPVKIDFSGINRDINVYENAIKADPIKPQKRQEKLEGLAAILGVDSKKI